MQSPCIDICIIHRERHLCEGCGRTLDEISNWQRMSAEEHNAVMAELPHRLKRLQDAGQNAG